MKSAMQQQGQQIRGGRLARLAMAAAVFAVGACILDAQGQQQGKPANQPRPAASAQQGGADQQLAQARAQLDRANRDLGELFSQLRELQAAIADGRLVGSAQARQAFIADFEEANEGLKVDPATLKVQGQATNAKGKE